MERKIAFIDPFIDEIIDKDIFEASCPYHQPGVDDLPLYGPWYRPLSRPLYRLIQTFDDKPSQYVGDSFGGRSYINVNVPRHCSQSCPCHSLEASGRYAFTVFKNSTTMVIETHDSHLSSWLADTLPIAQNKISNGLLLLKHLTLLEERFDAFKWEPWDYPFILSPRLEENLHLLIEDFLKDPQVFTSLGFGRLYEEGYLSYERWKMFHSSLTKENIDLLEASYSDEYEDQDLSHPSSHNPQKEIREAGDQSRRIRSPFEWTRSGLLEVPTRMNPAARGDHEELLRKVLGVIEDPEKPTFGLEKSSLAEVLVEVINIGCEKTVSLLLDHGAEVDGTGLMTGLPLRSALYAGNGNVIEILLSRGADIGKTWPEDSRDHWRFAEMLIDHGVDPYYLSSSVMRNSNKSADKRLVEVILAGGVRVGDQPQLRAKQDHQCPNPQQRRLRRFHSAFQQEYLRITRCKLSTYSYGKPWNEEYIGHRRQAFEEGIGVLRGLCKGQLPSSVSETIWFLAIARTMSFARDNVFDLDYKPSPRFSFSEDLGRWQMLFEEDEGALATFRMTIRRIWDVNLKDAPVPRQDVSSLTSFCDLAYGILQGLDHSFSDCSNGSGRLLASQEQWRLQTSSTPRGDIHEKARTPNEGPPPMSFGAHHFAWYQDREPFPMPVPDMPIGQSISNDQRLWSTKPLVRLLMAGAIFGIVITFLLGLLINKGNSQSSISSTSEGSLFHGQKQSMINAVEHMLKAVVSEIQPARQAIESIKRAAYTAIETAQLRTFQDLKNFLATRDFSHVSPTEHGCRHFRDCLIQACILWEPSYALQERYQVLESYLGLSHTLTIVPNTPRPRSYTEILETGKSTEATTTSDDGPSLVKSPVSSPISISSSSVDAVDSSMELPTLTSSPRLEAPPQQPKRSLPLQKTFCKDCNHDFEKICRYRRHRREKHEKVRFSCRIPPCLKTFSRNDYRDKHEARCHANMS